MSGKASNEEGSARTETAGPSRRPVGLLAAARAQTASASTGTTPGPAGAPGAVLDPFAGSGTTLLAAHGLSRDALGFDLDERNLDLARQRLGMFLDVDEPGRDTETVEAL